ncbi:MAG TPA: cyclic nucleotide-binding domain-containing protein [Vulgatibacter sp.]|nr:cyclic nucleotide-binding domain-containing protein [Vulgatibacter sp.]
MSTTSSLQESLRRALRLEPGEGRRTALASAYQLAFVATVVVVKSAAGAVVVARLPASALPPLYIASALITGLSAWMSARFDRGGTRHPAGPGLLVAGALLGLLALAARADAVAAIVGMYLFGEAFATLVAIRFWGAASELFDPRAGRRIFGLLGGAGMAGSIAAGLFTQLAGERLGAMGLVPVALALMVACLGAAFGLRRETRAGAPAPPPADRGARREDVRALLRRDRYPRMLAALMVLLSALTALADYVFRIAAHDATAGDEARLTSLFGALNLWAGIIAVVFQFAAAGRILERFGVFRYLLVTPVGSALAAAGGLVVPGLAPAFALRLIEQTGSTSLNPAAFQLLYGPIPEALRPHVRSFVDGFVKKVGFAAGGALLLLLGGFAGREVLVAAVVAVVALFALALAATRRLYVGAVERRVSRLVGVQDRYVATHETRTLLRGVLHEGDVDKLLASLSILSEDPRWDPLPHLPRLLVHPDLRVRRSAVLLAVERNRPAVAPLLERLFERDVPEIRYEVALALGRLAPARARALLAPWIGGRELPLAAAALAALVPSEARGGPATSALEAWLGDPGASVPERIELARALGRMGASPFASELGRLMDDADPEVRRATCVAAAKVRAPDLLPLLCERLGDLAARREAGGALVAYGDEAVPRLAAILDGDGPLGPRLEVPRLLRQIGTQAAADALLAARANVHPHLRHRIVRSLSLLHHERPDLEVDLARLQEALEGRIRAYRHQLSVWHDLRAALPPRSFLLRALDDRMQQNLEVAFRLLHLRHRGAAPSAGWRKFTSGDAKDRAFALELVENIDGGGLERQLLPLLERWHRLPPGPGAGAGRPDRAPERLAELAASADEELAAIAAMTAQQHGFAGPSPDRDEEGRMDEAVIERMFFLEGTPAFSRCDVDDLAALANVAKERTFDAGEAVFREGEEGDAIFLVVDGRIDLVRGERVALTVGPRGCLGETCLLEGAARPATAIAAGAPARLLVLDRQVLLELVADRPELLRSLFASASAHLHALIEGGSPGADDGRATG